ncbi:MAG: hypothetical protein QF718_02325 [Phycisphaerales bacterium]|nr:hypothetical protein [Phycisphaerales bacterium]
MKLASLLALSICLPVVADTQHWEFSENTNGNDVHWVSPNSVDPNADQFEYQYEITYVAVDVIFLGQIIGPNDVTGEIDPELLFGVGIVDGPAPIVMMDEPLEADADEDGEIDVAANIFMQINGNGFGQFDVTEVFLGDVLVDMGWPLGWQNVDIDRIYMDGYMDITPIIIECSEDTDGDGFVNVTDILAAIGNWGGGGAGDVDGSGIVDVSDLLAIVGAWGPC